MRSKDYTKEEDEVIIQAMLTRSGTIKNAAEIASKKINRSVHSIQNRWQLLRVKQEVFLPPKKEKFSLLKFLFKWRK